MQKLISIYACLSHPLHLFFPTAIPSFLLPAFHLIKISELIYQQGEWVHIFYFIKWARRSCRRWSSSAIQRNHYIIQRRQDLPPQRVSPTPCSYVDQKFLQSYKATVGADFMEKEVIVDGKVINLEVRHPLYRFGTRQGRRSLGAWVGPSTEGLIVAFLSTISPTNA